MRKVIIYFGIVALNDQIIQTTKMENNQSIGKRELYTVFRQFFSNLISWIVRKKNVLS